MTSNDPRESRKRSLRRAAALGLLLVAAVPVAALTVLSAVSRRPSNLGVTNERLAECPDTPNCVSTFAADDAHRMEPFPFSESAATALAKLKQVIEPMPGAKLVSVTERYVYAEFTSAVFRFVDDVEFLVDPAQKVIHFRSAPRVGRSDFGVNRKRMESVRM